VIYTDLAMMAGVSTVCEECEGSRFQASVLKYLLGGKNIADVLDLPVRDAVEFFAAGPAPRRRARDSASACSTSGSAICGWASRCTTLSGGERQRLKLATHMAASPSAARGRFGETGGVLCR
jgi:excinuclease UvrABC ATPase subunit